jgi:hypothetical protein
MKTSRAIKMYLDFYGKIAFDLKKNIYIWVLGKLCGF